MHKYIWIFIIGVILCFASCRKPVNFSDDQSLKVNFSYDTITFDTVFTSLGSSTRHLMVYNNNDENLKISSIRLQNGNMSQFSINVDGVAGYDFSDIEFMQKTVSIFSFE